MIRPDGRYLYAVDTGSADISSYAVAQDGTLTLLSSTPVSSIAGVTGTDVAISPDGRTLYVNMAKINSVGTFAVSGGAVTPLSTTPASGSGSTAGITAS